jgi:hypothetical protein
MRKVIVAILLILVVLVGGVLAYAATLPENFRFQRSTSIKAPPEKISALLTDFQAWGSWSPYEKKDPAMKRVFSGPAKGKGSVYEFNGDKNVGKGRLEIADTSPSRIMIKLDMIEPMEANNIVEFTLEPERDNTVVTWAMRGKCPYFAKVISVFLDMDAMVGKDFETGLASLKAVAER